MFGELLAESNSGADTAECRATDEGCGARGGWLGTVRQTEGRHPLPNLLQFLPGDADEVDGQGTGRVQTVP